MTFAKNIDSPDRIARIVLGLVLGLVLIALAVTGVFSPWGWIDVAPLGTARVNFCPLHALFGVRTCKRG
jgi:hypothetical protein